MKAYEVMISKDKVIYKHIGDFEDRTSFEQTLPEGFQSVTYSKIYGQPWEGHGCLMDAEEEGMPLVQDRFKYIADNHLYTLADSEVPSCWYSFNYGETCIPMGVQ